MTIEVTIDMTTKMIIEMTIEKIIMKEIHPIAKTDSEIGHVVGIETTIKMTIEVTMDMTTEMIIEMTIGKKIIGISKTRDIQENIKFIIKTHMTRITIELATKQG